MYFKTKQQRINIAIKDIQEQFEKINNVTSEDYQLWKLSMLELLKKYLGADSVFVTNFGNYEIKNEYKDDANKLMVVFGVVDLEHKARVYIDEVIEWIKKHGVKQDTLLKLYLENKDLVAIVFLTGAVFGYLGKPTIEKVFTDLWNLVF